MIMKQIYFPQKVSDRHMYHRISAMAAILTVVVLIVIVGTMSGSAHTLTRTAADTSYKYYTSIAVTQGDTLWSIARQYASPEYSSIEEYVLEVQQLNHLTDTCIHAGEYLMIPYYGEAEL